jgi:hypothetical protein
MLRRTLFSAQLWCMTAIILMLISQEYGASSGPAKGSRKKVISLIGNDPLGVEGRLRAQKLTSKRQWQIGAIEPRHENGHILSVYCDLGAHHRRKLLRWPSLRA